MFFANLIAELKEERAKNIRPEYLNRVEQISLEEYKHMRLNSYEREHLLPLFSDEVMLFVIDLAMKNSVSVSDPGNLRPATTYEQALVFRYLPELLKRYREKQ